MAFTTLETWDASAAPVAIPTNRPTSSRELHRIRHTAAHTIVGGSESLQKALQQIHDSAGHDLSVVIQGETGTGKELIARALHAAEGDSKRPFVAINCAETPEALMESEWFGHEKGAFTGADRTKPGRFELAHGGDLFLDEITTLSPVAQAKLLRVLQEHEVVRVGGVRAITAQFRLIAATNDNLGDMVRRGTFRADLYQRIAGLQIQLLPLRERPEDIPVLVAHFARRYGKPGSERRITASALRCLQQHPWPGNIRELEQCVRLLLIFHPDGLIEAAQVTESLPEVVFPRSHAACALPDMGDAELENESLRNYIRKAERAYIEKIIRQHGGNKDAAAAALKVGRTTLYAKLREYGLE